jgi:hypothetical protein
MNCSDCPSAKSSCLRTRLEVKERCIMQLMVELSSSIADLKAAKVENKRLREYANSFKTLTDALRDYEKSFPPRPEKRVRSVTTQCECESGESESD